MARVKRGVTAPRQAQEDPRKPPRASIGRRKNTIRTAKAAVDRSMQYAYRDRKNKKRTFRALWIQRINAAVREHGLTYSPIYRRPRQGRGSRSTARCLSEMAIHEPAAFAAYVERAKGRCRRSRPQPRRTAGGANEAPSSHPSRPSCRAARRAAAFACGPKRLTAGPATRTTLAKAEP